MIALAIVLALQTTQTSCQPTGFGGMNCTSTSAPSVDALGAAREMMRPSQEQQERLFAQQAQRHAEERERNSQPGSCEGNRFAAIALRGCSAAEWKRDNEVPALRKAVGAAAAEGRCDEAKAMALKAGDFDLAERAASLCSVAPKQ